MYGAVFLAGMSLINQTIVRARLYLKIEFCPVSFRPITDYYQDTVKNMHYILFDTFFSRSKSSLITTVTIK